MLKTRLCELLGIELPIVGAGMGGVALADLAAAISNAGGLGTIAVPGFPPEAIRAEIASARKLTSKPICVNLLVPFTTPETLQAVLGARVSAVTFFWGDQPERFIGPCRKAGIKAIWQCGSAEEAAKAKKAGADVVIAQGFEAGGHVRGTISTLVLVPQVRDAIGDLPMAAAGGIADGRGLAAVLALGADAAVFGTRFVASKESRAHPLYKQRIVEAKSEQTYYTTLFDVGWPDAPHRVLRTGLIDQWEQAGRPETGKRPGEGEQVAVSKMALGVPLVRYGVVCPTDYTEGAIDEMALYGGQSVGLVNQIESAGEIVKRIAREAADVIEKRLARLA